MSPWAELLYRALTTPYGIVISHEKPEVAVTQLRLQVRKQKDPALSQVSMTILKRDPGKVYLVTNTPPEYKDAQS